MQKIEFSYHVMADMYKEAQFSIHVCALQCAAEHLAQQRFLQFVEGGELVLLEGVEVLGFFENLFNLTNCLGLLYELWYRDD